VASIRAQYGLIFTGDLSSEAGVFYRVGEACDMRGSGAGQAKGLSYWTVTATVLLLRPPAEI